MQIFKSLKKNGNNGTFLNQKKKREKTTEGKSKKKMFIVEHY